MQYKASLIAVLGLTASSLAAPQLPAASGFGTVPSGIPSIPSGLPSTPSGFPSAPSNPFSTLPVPRDAQNLASPFSTANGAVSKSPVSKIPEPKKNGAVNVAANAHVARDVAGLHGIKEDVAPVNGVVDPLVAVAADVHVARNTLAITDVVSSVHSCKKTVVSDVSSIHTLINSVGTTSAGQQGLAEEIIKDLGEIVSALTFAVDGVLAQTLPTVVDVVLTEVSDVLCILNDVEAIVFQIVQVLEALVGGLLDSTLKLVDSELLEVYKLLNPVLTPVLKFVGLAQCDGDAGLIQEITSTVSGVVGSCNGLLSAKGLKEIEL